MRATSCARWPIEKDFSCGFQVFFSLGTRSRTRLVVAISWSNSAIIDWPIDIGSSSIGVVGGLRHGVLKLARPTSAAQAGPSHPRDERSPWRSPLAGNQIWSHDQAGPHHQTSGSSQPNGGSITIGVHPTGGEHGAHVLVPRGFPSHRGSHARGYER